MPVFIVLSSWQGNCECSLVSFDECRLSAKWLPALQPNLPTWAVSPPIGCHHLHRPWPFIIITQTRGWYSFYHTTEGRRLISDQSCLPARRSSPIPVITLAICQSQGSSELVMGRVHPWVGLGWIGLGRDF